MIVCILFVGCNPSQNYQKKQFWTERHRPTTRRMAAQHGGIAFSTFCSAARWVFLVGSLFLTGWKKVVLANGHEQNHHGQNDSTPGTEHGSKDPLDEAPELQTFHQIRHHFGHHLGMRLTDLDSWRQIFKKWAKWDGFLGCFWHSKTGTRMENHS